MDRVAVFVDAGYLYAQSAVALGKAGTPRKYLKLNVPDVVVALRDLANSCAEKCSFLRIYWYDGAISFQGPTLDQTELAETDNVKVRLGQINSVGQQKGVDSLIITDLIELSRNQAISDAVLLSGDEDLRIGVQIAQQVGVRVHLQGISPARGSQSPHLRREADTTGEWNDQAVRQFISLVDTGVECSAVPAKKAGVSTKLEAAVADPQEIENSVSVFVNTLTGADVENLKAAFASSPYIPSDIDGRLLVHVAKDLGREVTDKERKEMRKAFKAAIK